MKKTLLFAALLCSVSTLFAQVSYTAEDFILPYDGIFRPGVNPGSTPPWTDEELAEIAAGKAELGLPGAGVKALRPLLSEEFAEEYGYDYKISTYQYYDELGLKDNTLIVGFPSEEHKDPAYYCPSAQSELFANLYTDIWDNGENGTPINENNYYALYIYKMVTRYKDYVKFWEIWNEPGFDYTGALGWFPKGAPGNWWDNNPDPCDYKLRAPIFHYIRILRISYDVIKSVDPDAYVTLSGIGYPSFLDAILRNTDNPVDGSVTNDYPLGGGAYFDVLGFHSYPHFDGSVKVWSDSINGFLYTRHSDDAAAGITKQKDIFQEVLDDYGYDGITFPDKEWIVTECNIPRIEFGDFIGSELAQRNFIMKAYVESELSNILQLHIYRLGEEGKPETAYGEFEVMGLYQHLETTDVGYPKANEAAIAYKTTSDQLFGKTYDPVRTAALQFPNTIKGAAFYDEHGSYTYVMWAKTLTDRSEEASATYSFPAGIDHGQYIYRAWDQSVTKDHQLIGGQNIALNSTPVFFTEALFSTAQFSECVGNNISLSATNFAGATSWLWTMPGASLTTSTNAQVDISYNQTGTYEVMLEAKGASGATLFFHTETITIEEAPQAAYTSNVSGPIGRFSNASTPNAQTYLWDFGDGNTSTEPNPQHVYSASGNYLVSLTVENTCGSHTASQMYEIIVPSTTMISTTAKDGIDPYNGHFRPGVNLGIYLPWRDEDLADISAGNLEKDIPGIGAKSVRPVLYEEFLDYWGYDIRLETFQHYENLGLEDNTLIVGFPAEHHRDPNFYCPTHQSEHFENMYTDIWDNGENGTPVNDDNYYALYLYNVAIRYGKHVKFWEIWNEPSFDYSSLNGWLPPGQRGNWWENDPYPCDYKLRAPIQHFVRLLRISYEVLKTVDPDAYVTLSGVAFPSFLDAVLRNTDNPHDGSISAAYPHKGGAYFDVMGFHSYPHFDGSTSYYDIALGDWVYNRHSDAAADGLERSQDTLEQVLFDYDYDGVTYPEKHWIVTEANLPRKAFGNFIGSDEAQRNYIIKTFVNSVVNKFLQLHIYKIGEDATYDGAGFEFDLMGLYENLKGTDPADKSAIMTEEGIAYKTSSDILYGSVYDPQRSALLQLPNEIGGGAFKDANGEFTYVLWAKTTIDNSEVANANYSFPSGMNINQLRHRAWDYSITGEYTDISSQNISLTATPIFLSEDPQILIPPIAAFQSVAVSGCAPLSITFENLSSNATSYEWTFPTGTPSSSTEANPTVVFQEPGMHTAFLKATNAAGSHTISRFDYIEAETLPVAGFDFYVDGSFAFFTNTTQNDSTEYYWDFGDGFAFPATNPNHFYFFNGTYDVTLIAINECGSDTLIKPVTIAAPTSAEFTWNFISNCPPFELLFQDQSTASPTAWQWSFPGGTPSSSNLVNPTTSFPAAGDYPVTLIVDNGVTLDTLTKIVHLEDGAVGQINETLCSGEIYQYNGTVYDESNPTGTETIPNGSVMGCDSIININLSFLSPDSTFLFISTCPNSGINPGTYTDTYSNQQGCDSVVITVVEVLEEIVFSLNEELCEGETITVNGTVYDQNNPNGVDTISGGALNGCDSIIVVDLNFYPTAYLLLTDTIELGETYLFGGINYTESGLYTDSLLTVNGCDSIIQLNLTVLDKTTSIGGAIAPDFKFKAFPNPFEKETLLHFRLPASAVARMSVYDLHGRQVIQVFAKKDLASGDHFYKLAEEQIPAGIYYCRLEVNGEVVVLRLVKI